MKEWLNRAMTLLHASLEPPRHELNELDWKSALSPDKRRLSEHLSALANHPGGGFLVYGVDNAGTPGGVDSQNIDATLNQLSNLGRDALVPPLTIDHAVAAFDAVPGVASAACDTSRRLAVDGFVAAFRGRAHLVAHFAPGRSRRKRRAEGENGSTFVTQLIRSND